MKLRSTNKLLTMFSRVIEYVMTFGWWGVFVSLEHLVKFKILKVESPIATEIPEFGTLYLRSRTSDLATFREIFVNGEYDVSRLGIIAAIDKRFKAVLDRGRIPLVVDVGANIGLASRYLAYHYPKAEFLLIEASHESASVAKLNAKAIQNSRVVEAAVWDKDGQNLKLIRTQDASTRSLSEAVCDGEFEVVVTSTLDTILIGRLEDLVLVKMDIEGAESRVLSPSSKWLATSPIILIEPHDGTMNDHGSLSGLLSIGDYQKGKIILSGSTMAFVPRTSC